MSKSAKSEGRRKAAGNGQLWLRLPDLVRDALYETVIGAGLACVDQALEAERVALCGARYEHAVDRKALRAGHVGSSLVLGGRRVAMNRPRARSVEGRERGEGDWPIDIRQAVAIVPAHIAFMDHIHQRDPLTLAD